MMNPQVKFIAMYILGKVDKTGITVLQNIIDQLLYYSENKQFFFRLKPVFIIMKTLACIYGAAAADLLEKIIDSRFQPKVFSALVASGRDLCYVSVESYHR